MSSIPKTIYYCWFGGEKPENVLACLNNWKEKLPEYNIVEINEYNKELFDLEKECQNSLWFKTVWEHKMWAYAADYARLKVLYENGGVYFDTDITIEKDITELLEKDKLVLGWEDKKLINFAVGIVPAKNQIIKEMFDFYNDEIWNSKLYSIPHITTHTLQKHYKLNPSTEITENEDILILPYKYFYPLPIGLKDKAGFVTENTYTIHWWDATWTKSNIDCFLRNKHKVEYNKLINYCFKRKTILNNKFIQIEKLHQTFTINMDWYYAFRFKYRYWGKNRFLTIFIFGIQIPLFKIGGRNEN